MGVDVHVALPSLEGRAMPYWRDSGAQLHPCNLNLPVTSPVSIMAAFSRVRQIVQDVRPDLIHTHFVSSTLTVRLALGRRHPIPRIFQVPGPLHLEHAFYRHAEIRSAGEADYWIASSKCVRSLYIRHGVDSDRVFLSYYGFEPHTFAQTRSGALRDRLSIPSDSLVVGNINLVYKPKRYLGQSIGLKAHEHVIRALAIVTARRSDVFGLLIGGPWGNGASYFERLREQAARVGKGRILMPGAFSSDEIPSLWPEFDCAVHVPLSENCGGVVEPLAAGVPTIAGKVGGLPEVVLDGITGVTVPICAPEILSETILNVLDTLPRHKVLAQVGRNLVTTMFAVERTAEEVKQVYEYVLGYSAIRPADFDSRDFASNCNSLRAC